MAIRPGWLFALGPVKLNALLGMITSIQKKLERNTAWIAWKQHPKPAFVFLESPCISVKPVQVPVNSFGHVLTMSCTVLFVYCLRSNDARLEPRMLLRWAGGVWRTGKLISCFTKALLESRIKPPSIQGNWSWESRNSCTLAITCFVKSMGLCVWWLVLQQLTARGRDRAVLCT